MTHAWVAFAELVADRLEKGRTTYGDVSFDRAPVELAKEVEEEILDVCAWSFILWTRLRNLRRRLAAETTAAGEGAS